MRNEKRADGSGGGVRRHPGSLAGPCPCFRDFWASGGLTLSSNQD